MPLKSGTTFLGYRVFFHYKLLRRRNLRTFQKRFERSLRLYKKGDLTKEELITKLQGWFGYAKRANTHKLRKEISDRIENN